MRDLRKLAAAALLSLASCGGGGSSGGTVTSPTPAPPTSTTPTPTPSPDVRFTLEAGGGVPGFLSLVVGDDPKASTPQAQFYTDLSGSVVTMGRGATLSPYGGGGGTSAGFPLFDFSASYALSAYGIESPTRIVRSFTAPRTSTTVSPLTTLVQIVGDQQTVKNVLGLGTVSTFILPADLNLTTYSATQDLASGSPKSKPGQVLSANIRVLALQQAVEVFSAAPATPTSFGMDFSAPLATDARIAAYIRANPTAKLDTIAGIRDFLRQLRDGSSTLYRDDVLEAAAGLVQSFGLATRLIDTDATLAPRYSTAVMAALRPRLDDLAQQNSAAAAAAAGVPANFLQDEAGRTFADQLPFPTGKFVPVNDFFRMAAGTQFTVFKDNTPGYTPGGSLAARPNMTGNDALWGGGLRYAPPATIRSVTVPAALANAIDAVLQSDGSVRVTGKPGFAGIAWYDYVTALDSGEVESGRVYLFIR